jgi:hypothetical protein
MERCKSGNAHSQNHGFLLSTQKWNGPILSRLWLRVEGLEIAQDDLDCAVLEASGTLKPGRARMWEASELCQSST